MTPFRGPGFLNRAAAYFTRRARFAPCELETLLAHLTPFRAGSPG